MLENDVYVSLQVVSPFSVGFGLTNNATLQVNGLRRLTGTFVQNNTGTLVMQVGPEGASQLKVVGLPFFGGGTASLAGTLALAYQPGIYRARIYTLLSADHGVTGTFSTVTGIVPTAGLAQSISVSANSVDLLLTSAAGVLNAVGNETTLVAPTNDTIFSVATTTAVLNGQWTNRMLLDRCGSRQPGIADGRLITELAVPARFRTASEATRPQLTMSAGVRFHGSWHNVGRLSMLRGGLAVFLAAALRILPTHHVGFAASVIDPKIQFGFEPKEDSSVKICQLIVLLISYPQPEGVNLRVLGTSTKGIGSEGNIYYGFSVDVGETPISHGIPRPMEKKPISSASIL